MPGRIAVLLLSTYPIGFRYTFSSGELVVFVEVPFLVINARFFAIGLVERDIFISANLDGTTRSDSYLFELTTVVQDNANYLLIHPGLILLAKVREPLVRYWNM